MYHLHKCCSAMAAKKVDGLSSLASRFSQPPETLVVSSCSPQDDAELRPCTPKDMRHDLLHIYLPATDRELTTEICMIKNGSKTRFRHRFRKSLADQTGYLKDRLTHVIVLQPLTESCLFHILVGLYCATTNKTKKNRKNPKTEENKANRRKSF